VLADVLSLCVPIQNEIVIYYIPSNYRMRGLMQLLDKPYKPIQYSMAYMLLLFFIW